MMADSAGFPRAMPAAMLAMDLIDLSVFSDREASVVRDSCKPRRGWEARTGELQTLIDALNTALSRVAQLTLKDLEALGVPDDILDELQERIAHGDGQAIVAFLEEIASSPLGAALSREAKRAIRAAGRGSRGWQSNRSAGAS